MSYREHLIAEQLEKITVGHTTTLRGKVVTRWSEGAYEVGTWGRSAFTLEQTAEVLTEKAAA